jgi:hypothetical protein
MQRRLISLRYHVPKITFIYLHLINACFAIFYKLHFYSRRFSGAYFTIGEVRMKNIHQLSIGIGYKIAVARAIDAQ